jgi:ATP-binding cassette subfamily C protein
MKKILKKTMIHLVIALLIGSGVLILDALLNIQMMKTVDGAMAQEDSFFKLYVLPMTLITLAILPMNLLMAFLKGRYKMHTMKNLKHHYLTNVFNKDIAAFDAEHSSDYVSTITQDMTVVEKEYVTGRFEVPYQVLSFVFGLAVIVYVSPWIPVVGATLALFVAGFSIVLSKPIKAHQKTRSDMFHKYTAYIQSSLNAFHIIKVNHLTDKAKFDFHQKSQDIQNRRYIIDKMSTFIFALQNLLMTSLLFGMIGAATYLTIQGKMSFGGIILVITSSERIMGPIQIVGEWIPKMSSSKALLSKMEDQLKKDVQIHVSESNEMIMLKDSLKLDQVSFSYNVGQDNMNEVLSKVCLEIKRGQKCLVMGPSGGGKSTFLKLLRKYHNPLEGEIYVDNMPLSGLSHRAYYQMIANVEQHVFLFEDSLKENLCLYKDYTDAEIEKAILDSGLKNLLDKLPEGLNTVIYDNGRNLSGGERSRIAIARALLQKAQILILDEAFSSLDDDVAKAIEKTLLALEDVTLINVSHVCFDETKHNYDQVLNVSHKNIA